MEFHHRLSHGDSPTGGLAANRDGQNTFPDYVLAKNQQSTPENLHLINAAEAGSLTGVLNSLQKGANPDYFFRSHDNKNALHIASESGYTDIVEALLEHGAVVDAITIPSKSTALILSSEHDHSNVVNILIKNGANVNVANTFGNTALHEAARLGFVDLCKILLRAGARVDASNHKGSAPLHFACYGESTHDNPLEVVRILIEAGAQIDQKDERNMTPLLVCCVSGRLDILNYLRENGADPTLRDSSGRDAHDIAVFYNHRHIADLFGVDSPAKRFG